ncbi:quinon protein alcohol dehydrogenase-like superfamily [Baffinella frigidus]|nr:quinon protein alcohol dehydrogenase-like superfamily [Cryptophyta sp. CCMP2293]
MLALGLESGRVMLVDEATGEEKWAVQAHPLDSETKVAMSPGNGRFVASVGEIDEKWKLWDAASGALHRVGATHDGTGACICAVQDVAQRVLHEGCPVVAHIWELTTLAFSPCGQRFATGGEDGAVIVWDSQTGEAGQRMQGGAGRAIWTVSFSADGARLASGNDDCSIRVWDVATGGLLRTIPAAHDGFLVAVCFSPTDNRILASAGASSQTHLWDVDSGEKIRSIAGSRFAVFSPDGRTIASAIANTTRDLRLIDAESGALRFRLVGHEDHVSCASFSVDDGSKLASGSSDGTCKVWDSSTGALLRTINAGAEGYLAHKKPPPPPRTLQ